MTSLQPTPPHRPFKPALPSGWLLWIVQSVLRITLGWQNRLIIDERDLDILRDLPEGMGVILTPNHADEVDPRICLELARRCNRRFIFMGNREAFDELLGAAGWGLQRMGLFSVERGGHDAAAKQFAVDAVRQGKDVLVIFPEGEIYYLNDSIQPFHSGAVDIGIQGVIDARKTNPDWTALVVPMAIKYKYTKPINHILEKRVQQLEQRLSLNMTGYAMRKRLTHLLSEVLQREEKAHHLPSDTDRFAQLTERVTYVRHAVLAELEQKYSDPNQSNRKSQARTIDRAWKLSAELRGKIQGGDSPERQAELKQDLASLSEVARMVSWQPEYVDLDPSNERLAELIKKLEREIYGMHRPKQMAPRNVFVRIGEPVDLSQFIAQYSTDPHSVRHDLAEQLRATIQAMVDGIVIANATPGEPEEVISEDSDKAPDAVP